MMRENNRWHKLKSLLYVLAILAIIFVFFAFLLTAGGCNTPKKNVSPPLGKLGITSKNHEKGNSSLFIYRLVLLGGVGFIIYLLLKPKNMKINSFSLSELKNENLKVKTQNDCLSKQIELQNAEKSRMLDALQEKEIIIKSMLENEGFLSKGFSEFKKQTDKLQNEKDHLEKQLGEKLKELEARKLKITSKKSRQSKP